MYNGLSHRKQQQRKQDKIHRIGGKCWCSVCPRSQRNTNLSVLPKGFHNLHHIKDSGQLPLLQEIPDVVDCHEGACAATASTTVYDHRSRVVRLNFSNHTEHPHTRHGRLPTTARSTSTDRDAEKRKKTKSTRRGFQYFFRFQLCCPPPPPPALLSAAW